MIDKSIIITFRSEEYLDESENDSDDWIKLKIKDDDDGYGNETFIEWMENQGYYQNDTGQWEGVSPLSVFSFYQRYLSTCSEGNPQVKIEVHKSRQDLEYTIKASHGYLTPSPIIMEDRDIESETVRGTTELKLDKVVTSSPNAYFEMAFDMKGNVINPNIQFNQEENKLVWDEKTIGVIRKEVTYTYDLYILSIAPRTEPPEVNGLNTGVNYIQPAAPETFTIDDIEDPPTPAPAETFIPGEISSTPIAPNLITIDQATSEAFVDGKADKAFQSTVIAIWGEGNFDTLDVNIDLEDSECVKMAYQNKTNPDDEDKPDIPESETCYELHRLYDPCTKQLLDEWKEVVSCPE